MGTVGETSDSRACARLASSAAYPVLAVGRWAARSCCDPRCNSAGSLERKRDADWGGRLRTGTRWASLLERCGDWLRRVVVAANGL